MSLADATANVYVYPAPPPTTNVLSQRQKDQLRRSTTKLTKILGATPYLVDRESNAAPFHAKVPHSATAGSFPSLSRTTTTSGSSSSHSQSQSKAKAKPRNRTKSFGGERYDPESYPLSSCTAPPRRTSHYYHPSNPNRTSTSIESNQPRIKPCPTPRGVPRSRFTYPESSVEPQITVSERIFPSTSVSSRRRCSQASIDTKSPLRDSICDSIYDPPTFIIPSPSALRRAKMARISKRLGEGVPVTLVFPEMKNDDVIRESSIDSNSDSERSSSSSEGCDVLSLESGSTTLRSSSHFDQPLFTMANTASAIKPKRRGTLSIWGIGGRR